jgi:aminoglycoside phosphotransferase family enzyme/predicted kinase
MLIDNLLNPAVYPHRVKKVRLVETHISWVLLAGRYAYKIKKPVNLQFLDFTNLSARRFFCEEEIRLNRRFAPQLYLGVVGIGGSPEHPEFNAEPAFEYAVKMKRFAAKKGLDLLLANHKLQPVYLDEFAVNLAGFHQHLPCSLPEQQYGSPEVIAAIAQQNFSQLRTLINANDNDFLTGLETACKLEYQACLEVFKNRRETGFIRECHGDLHLGNLTLLKQTPLAFDSLEFDANLRWIDVINEVAFLVMDLQYHDRLDLAYRFLNAYLEQCGDYPGLAVLRYYMANRAIVRGKIAALSASFADKNLKYAELKRYLDLAALILKPAKPLLIICHGLPGCGKTSVAQHLLETLPAIRLRSDVERKRLFGLSAQQASQGEIYSEDATRQTYARLLQQAAALLKLGYNVIVDAAFLKHLERQAFMKMAAEMAATFVILSIHAEPQQLQQRILQRQILQNDASEANLEVLAKLSGCQEALQTDELGYVINYTNNGSLADLANDQSLLKQIRQMDVMISQP